MQCMNELENYILNDVITSAYQELQVGNAVFWLLEKRCQTHVPMHPQIQLHCIASGLV